MRFFGAVGGFLLVVGLAFGGGYWMGRGSAPDDAAIAATERSIELLNLELAMLRPLAAASKAEMVATVDTAWLPARTIIERYRDSLRVPVPFVIGLATAGDKVVNACSVAVRDCTERAEAERARGDSLAVARDQWKARARGPFVEFGVAGLVDREGLMGRGDARLRLGEHWRALVEVEQRADAGGPVVRGGARYAF